MDAFEYTPLQGRVVFGWRCTLSVAYDFGLARAQGVERLW